ncbi:MAG: heavy metal-binding domain-containing protein [Bacteroidota bacterium]
MRFTRFLAAVLLAFSLSLFFTACGDSATSADGAAETTTTTTPHGEGKEYTSAYVCPMHCDGSGSDQAGECPVCGMDYVASAEHTKNGHTH